MLLLAVLLLLSAGGLLIATFVTGHVVLAWGSVGVSAAAGLVLLVRQRRSRQRVRDEPAAVSPLREEPVDSESAGAESADAQLADAEPASGRGKGSGDVGPAEEDTDAADLSVVLELADEVLVVDEYPRYHLADCSWSDSAHVERLPVREARELGFTPCAQCSPDTALARRHRAESAT